MSSSDVKKISDKLDRLWSIASDAMRSRNYTRAIKALETILRVDEKNAAAYNRLGIVYAKIGDFDQSIHCFKKANKYERSASSEHNLGLIYFETAQYKKAKKHLDYALKVEPLATRHVALAKVLEKLGKDDVVLQHLEKAMQLEPSRQTQQIYIDAYARYGGNDKKLSEELLEAIQKNKIDWDYEILDNYPLLIEILQSLHKMLQDLVFERPRIKLSLRDENAKSLMITYLHNLSACIPLLSRNFSLASANLARSMFEIYLQVGFGMLERSNRGFAEIEKSSLVGKMNANNRLFGKIDKDSDLYHQKVEDNRRLHHSIASLDSKYKKLTPTPSYREIAILLDRGILGENYSLYEHLYEKGSDIIHAERTSISRSVQLSNTRHAGLFMDSYEIINNLIDLTIQIGKMYLKSIKHMPTKNKYQKQLNALEDSLATVRKRRFATPQSQLVKRRRVFKW